MKPALDRRGKDRWDMEHEQERQQVIHIGQEIYRQRLVAGTWGNISCRLEPTKHILITPSGMPYATLQPRDLVVLDREGRITQGHRKPSSEFPLHVKIYQERPDVGAIVHVHSPWACAYAVAHQPIPMLLEESAQVLGDSIPVAQYAQAGSEELAISACRALGTEHKAVLLANHGLVGLGQDLEEALLVCVIAEKTAMIGLMARSLGTVNSLAAEDVKYLHQSFREYGQPRTDN